MFSLIILSHDTTSSSKTIGGKSNKSVSIKEKVRDFEGYAQLLNAQKEETELLNSSTRFKLLSSCYEKMRRANQEQKRTFSST